MLIFQFYWSNHVVWVISFHSIGISVYTKILEVNLFAFAYRLFHEDFSPIDGALFVYKSSLSSTLSLVIPELICIIWYIILKTPIHNSYYNFYNFYSIGITLKKIMIYVGLQNLLSTAYDIHHHRLSIQSVSYLTIMNDINHYHNTVRLVKLNTPRSN